MAVLALLAVAALFMGFFYLRSSSKIELVNESKYYKIQFGNIKLLEKYMDEWGVWKEKNTRLSDLVPYETVKKIKIYITDKPQSLLVVSKKPQLGSILTNNEILHSVNGLVDSDGTYHIYVYLSPDLRSHPLEYINRAFTRSLTDILYGSTHTLLSRQDQMNNIEPANDEMSINMNNYPIKVTVRK